MHNHDDMAERLKEPRYHEVHLEWMDVMCIVVFFIHKFMQAAPNISVLTTPNTPLRHEH